MKKTLYSFFVFAVVAGLILSACGGASMPSNPLVIAPEVLAKDPLFQVPSDLSQGFHGMATTPYSIKDVYVIKGLDTGRDLSLVKVQDQHVVNGRLMVEPTFILNGKLEGNNLDEMVAAMREIERITGGNPASIVVDGKIIWRPNRGIPLGTYLSKFGTPERASYANNELVRISQLFCKNGFCPADLVDINNWVIDARTGIITLADVEHAYPWKMRGKWLDAYPLYDLDTFNGYAKVEIDTMFSERLIGLMPDVPEDASGKVNPAPTAFLQADSNIPIWEEVPYPPEVGANFRGSEVFDVRIDSKGRVWGAFAGNPGRDVTWYTIENGQVVFQREFAGYVQITEEIDDYVNKFQRGTGSTAWATVDNGKVYMESSDLGVPYDSYVIFGEKPSLQSLQSDVLAIEQEYMNLYDLEIAFEDASEVGTRQIAKQRSIVKVVDYEFAVNPRISTMPHLKDRTTYQQWVRNILREDFAILADDFGYLLDDIVPPLVTIQIAPIVPVVPAQGTIPVNILDYNGKPQTIWLTEAEYASGILKTPEAVEFLRAKNVAMPPASKWTTPLSFVGKSFIWALDAYGVYYTIEQSFDWAGLGSSVQLDGIDMNTDNFSENANKNWTQLTNEGHWTMSPLLTWYYQSNDDFYNLMQGRIHEKEPCAQIRLDDRVRFGVLGDDDVKTPFVACPIENGFTITNFLDGSSMTVTKDGDLWIVAGSQEMHFDSAVGNPSGKYYISPMRLWNDGVLLNVLPTWQEIQ